jgi:hypothetical protein
LQDQRTASRRDLESVDLVETEAGGKDLDAIEVVERGGNLLESAENGAGDLLEEVVGAMERVGGGHGRG